MCFFFKNMPGNVSNPMKMVRDENWHTERTIILIIINMKHYSHATAQTIFGAGFSMHRHGFS